MNIERPTSFGELLQLFRKHKKIRQQVLANKLGVHRNTIGAWEQGDRLPDTRGIVVEWEGRFTDSVACSGTTPLLTIGVTNHQPSSHQA